jgi:vacuolar-type H+-ATPase subunit E/Vma4
MAIDDLLHALAREAEAEVEANRAAGFAEAEAIAAAAAERRADATRAGAREHRAAAQVRADAEVAAVSRRTTSAVLAARAAMLEQLRAAVLEALPGVVDEPMRVRMRAAVRAAAGGAPVGLRDLPTGVVGELDGGRVTIDATLASLFERSWPRLRVAAVREVAP